MSDEDPTKELPSVPDTEPTMYTVMERLNGLDQRLTSMQESADRRHAETQERFNGLDERLTTMDERLTTMDERLTNTQESADRRHAETNANFRKLGDKMEILNGRVLDTEANQVDLRRRIDELETKPS